MESQLITTGECALRRGVSRQAVAAAIKRGALPARKIGRDYLIRVEDCEAYRPAMTPADKGRRNAKPKRGPGRPRTHPPQGERS